MYLVHGLRGGRIGLLTKVHHALADGISGNEILTALLDRGRDGRDEAFPPADRLHGIGVDRHAQGRGPRRQVGDGLDRPNLVVGEH